MSGHALLSASSAHRWMNCTPSALLATFKKSGTASHWAAELVLLKISALITQMTF